MRKILIGILGGIVGLVVVGFVGLLAAARLAGQPENLGVRDGKLAPCPNRPNCVSSQSDDGAHAIEPIPYNGDTAAAKTRLIQVINDQPRTALLQVNDTYIHALFRSPTVGFPDDVEFLFDEQARLIHVRSAARMGYDDMGVNRKRVEQLRAAFAK